MRCVIKKKVNLNSRGRGDDGKKSVRDAKIIKYRSKLHVISFESSQVDLERKNNAIFNKLKNLKFSGISREECVIFIF